MAERAKNERRVLKWIFIFVLAFWAIWFAFGCGVALGDRDFPPNSRANVFSDFNLEAIAHFGDGFGAFSALVNVLGFGALIYSMNRAHEDAKAEEIRFNKTILEQQKAFEQNSRIALLDKRLAIFEAFMNIVKAGSTQTMDPKIYQNGSALIHHVELFFADCPEIVELLIQIENNASTISAALTKQTLNSMFDTPIDPDNTNKIIDLQQWFMSQKNKMVQLFAEYIGVKATSLTTGLDLQDLES